MAETGDTKVETVTENAEKQKENTENPSENTATESSTTEQQSEPSEPSEPQEKKEYFYIDKLTPEQRRERTLRIVDEILSRKNSEAAHVHHRTIEARGMFRKQRDITRDLQKTRDDLLNMEVEVNDMKRKMMLRRHAPSGSWRADKFIYDHPRLKYSLEDFSLR